MRLPSLLALTFLACLPACGGDDGDVEPAIVPGGGVRDPGIDGVVNVFVIDEDTDQPLAGATVRVGATEGTTDAAGLLVVKEVTGPQTVLARATGYAPSMWVGVDGANVTIPLTRTPSPTAPAPFAQLSGSITGWDALPAPAEGHVRAALVTFAQDPELGSTANDLMQPPAVGGVPANACVRLPGAGSPPCAWRLNARTGTIALGLVIIDIDGRGTPSDEDDVQTITGYAVKQPVTVLDGANQSGLMMDLPPANSTVTASVDFGAPPAALTGAAAIVGLDLGAHGVFRFATAERTRTSLVLPNLPAFPGTTYELLAFAQEPATDGTAAQSIVLRRGLTSASALAAGAWLPPPTGLASDRQTVSFTAGSTEGVHAIELDTRPVSGPGNRALSIALLDGSTQVTLPADFAPLPAGPLTLRVQNLATDEPLDPRDFAIDDVIDGVTRAASDTILLD